MASPATIDRGVTSRRVAARLAVALAAAASPAPAAPVALAHGLTLIPGSFAAGLQPDGNSVLIDAPDGLIVFDTGRHAAVSDAISAAARSRGRPVVAIVNSHWHLDHVSGNIRLKAQWPAAKVYASAAIDRALAGFLAFSAKDARAMLADPKLDPAIAAEVKGDFATFDKGEGLRPDVVIARSAPMVVGSICASPAMPRPMATSGWSIAAPGSCSPAIW